MKKMTKLLAVVLAVVMCVGIGVGATLAWLKDETQVVTNKVVAVGDLDITLDESVVDVFGVKAQDNSRTETGNDYQLMPGHTYTKDPIVHFVAGSDAAHLYVEINNELLNIVGDLDDQITGYGWTKLAVEGKTVYYMDVEANKTLADIGYPVFDYFTIGDAETSETLSAYQDKTITIKAYAIQSLDTGSALDAWNANFAG